MLCNRRECGKCLCTSAADGGSFLLISQPEDRLTKCVNYASSNGKMPQQSSLVIPPTRVKSVNSLALDHMTTVAGSAAWDTALGEPQWRGQALEIFFFVLVLHGCKRVSVAPSAVTSSGPGESEGQPCLT